MQADQNLENLQEMSVEKYVIFRRIIMLYLPMKNAIQKTHSLVK